jgi:hypothetical protein
MKKKNLTQVLVGAIMVALGILVAIFGTEAFDLYFGILAVAVGAVLLGYAIFLMSKKQVLTPAFVIIPAVLLTIGITLLVGTIGFAALVGFIVVLILGFGAGLVLYGIYLIIKKATLNGVIHLVIGVIAVTLSILYLTVPDFAKAFWVIVGIVIALYGILEIVDAFIEKK